MEQLDKGVIEKVPKQEVQKEDCHFISHPCIIWEDKATTKVRVVFDGSACCKENSISLNDRLAIGHNFFLLYSKPGLGLDCMMSPCRRILKKHSCKFLQRTPTETFWDFYGSATLSMTCQTSSNLESNFFHSGSRVRQQFLEPQSVSILTHFQKNTPRQLLRC